MRFCVGIACTALALGCGSGDDGAAEQTADEQGPIANREATPGGPPPRRIEHDVFDLIDNRLLAHRLHAGSLVIDAGSGGFARYTRFGRARPPWRLAQSRDGVHVAVPGRGATIIVPMTEAQAAATQQITFRVHAPKARSISVRINASPKSGHPVKLESGWQTVSVPTTGSHHAGANVISVGGSNVGFAWVQVGGSPLSDSNELPLLYDAKGDALVLGDGDGLAYYVQVPEAGHLVADVFGADCGVRVSARSDAGREAGGELRGERAGVDLSSLAGEIVRLEMTAFGCDTVRLTNAALTIPGPTPTVRDAPPPKNVILWIMDTLRGDKMRTVNPKARAEIPHMAKLAANGAGFRQFYVQGNESQTSHSSIWTSLYPANHKVITAGKHTNYRLSKRFDAIGPLLKQAGLHTVGVTANGNIHGWTGYTRGINVFNNVMRDGTGRRLKFRVPGDVVYERALQKLGDDYKQPFFLFIGTTDSHKPWFGHQPWLDRYDPGPYKGRFEKQVYSSALGIKPGTHICTWKVPPREMQRIHAIIDSTISYQDELVGKLLTQLEEWGIADETMFIITSDHGEELWEYPLRCGHGSSLRETLVHVPLIISYPPLISGGAVLEGVDGVDILPTILDALDRPILEQAQGESLIPLLQGVGRGYPRPSYASMNEWAHTMRLGRWKGWVGQKGILLLHDTVTDPFEYKDFARERPFVRQFVNDAFAIFLANRKAWKKRHWGVASNMTARAARDIDAHRGTRTAQQGSDEGEREASP